MTTVKSAVRTVLCLKPFLRMLDIGEAAVPILIIELYSAGAFQNAGLRDKELFVFHAIWHTHNDFLLILGRRNLERRRLRFEKSGNTHTSFTAGLIKLPRNRHELRFVNRRHNRRENLEP